MGRVLHEMYPDNFLASIMEGLDYVERSRAAPPESLSRADVLDAMESRLSHLLRVMLSTPTSTSYSFFLAPEDAGESAELVAPPPFAV